MRQGVDAASHLLGLTEARADREPAVLTLRLGAPHEAGLTVIDRRDGTDRTYRLDLQADDLPGQIAAIRGGRPEGRAKVIVDPAACFIRTLDLPSAALPRMRAVLAQELEAATPFRADQVFSDWYVEGEDPETRTLRVRHVVLKRARLGPVLAALAGAGLTASVVAVGPAEDRTMPVDLLSSGHHALPGLLRSSGNLVLVAATGCSPRRLPRPAPAPGGDARCPRRRLRHRPPGGLLRAAPGGPGRRRRDAGRARPPARADLGCGRRGPAGHGLGAVPAPHPRGTRTDLARPRRSGGALGLGRLPGFGAPELRQSSPMEGGQRLVVALPRRAAGARP